MPRKHEEDLCPICQRRNGKRFCPDYNYDICSKCCGPRRADKKCMQDHCAFGFEKILVEETDVGKVEHHFYKSLDKNDALSDVEGQLIAWCYKPCKALDGKKPSELSKTKEGRERLDKLFVELEKKTKRTAKLYGMQPVDYTVVKKELGLL